MGGRCLEGVWRVSMGCLKGMLCVKMYLKGNSGQVRIGQVGTDQVRTGQFRTGQVRTGQVRTGHVRID